MGSYTPTVPFPDEMDRDLEVVPHDPAWLTEYAVLAARLNSALGGVARSIDHVGSTVVSGLAAKNCIDVQIQVTCLAEEEGVINVRAGTDRRTLW
jgi:GrpB-like predicted nucleotidyltransferase (UPF0157 family)